MAATEAFSGTETVSTSEWSMTTDTAGPDVNTTAGTYQAVVDVSALADGDTFDFRVYEKVISGATQRVIFCHSWVNAQGADSALWVSPPLLLIHGWDMTLLKVAGTNRSISWSIRTP